MLELMSRQQKEQILMQENFKKQQILLLAQIRKAFPEISILSLSEAISGKSTQKLNTDKESPIKNKTKKDSSNIPVDVTDRKYENQKTSTVLENNCHSLEIDLSPNHEISKNSINQNEISDATTKRHQNTCQSTQTIDKNTPPLNSRFLSTSIKIIDDIPVGNPLRRHSSVSRQLFPFDNKPILDTANYTEEHVSFN